MIGTNMAWRLEQQKKSGVIYGYSLRRVLARRHAQHRLVEEHHRTAARNRIRARRLADRRSTRANCAAARRDSIDYKATINHPNPWTGGTWRHARHHGLRAHRLGRAARNRRRSSRGSSARRGRRARARRSRSAPNEAYRIPHDQHDWPTAQLLAALLLEHGVEIQQADNGDYWIPMAQPYSTFLVEMLEPQRYPEVRLQAGKDILQAVRRRHVDAAAGDGRHRREDRDAGANRQQTGRPRSTRNEGSPPQARERQEAAHRHLQPVGRRARTKDGRAGCSITYGFTPKSLHPQEVKAGLQNFDASSFRTSTRKTIATGRRADRRRIDEVRRRSCRRSIAAGSRKKARRRCDRSSRTAERCIAFSAACDYVIENFNIPVRNVLAKPADFSVPGSLVRVKVAYGSSRDRRDARRRRRRSSTIRSRSRRRRPATRCSAGCWPSYPDDARDILLSGWIAGEERLAGKAAAVAMTYGKGQIVLFAFRPQHRGQTHATFPLMFNALYW